MSRDRYGAVDQVERENLTAAQEEGLRLLLKAGAIDDRHRASVWNLKRDHEATIHGRTLHALHERGLIDGVLSLINEDWGNTHTWWLTTAGVEEAQRLTQAPDPQPEQSGGER